jgi:hypothetical protein
MALQLIETAGGFAGEASGVSASWRSPAAPNDVNRHLSNAVRRAAARPLRADRTSIQGRFVARIEAAALELGEYLCPSISMIASVCERLTMWAGSDGHWPDAALASLDRSAETKRAAVEHPSLQVDAHARRSLPLQAVTCGSLPSSQFRL